MEGFHPSFGDCHHGSLVSHNISPCPINAFKAFMSNLKPGATSGTLNIICLDRFTNWKSYGPHTKFSSELLTTAAQILIKGESVISDAGKKPTLDMTRPYVVYDDMPAVDVGGPKRQFFTATSMDLKDNHALFEGSDNQLFPVYSTGVIASGLLKVLGQVIVHSILQEGPGFPFLDPCIYHYICTSSVEEALQLMSLRCLHPLLR